MADDHFDVATKADVYQLEAKIEQRLGNIEGRLGRIEGQLAIMLRVIYYIAGLFSALAIRFLFFKI
jgi:hypothetical protein